MRSQSYRSPPAIDERHVEPLWIVSSLCVHLEIPEYLEQEFSGDPGDDDLIDRGLAPLGVESANEGMYGFFGSGVRGGSGI